MWDFVDVTLSENFEKIFFSLITIIVVGAAILDIRNKNQPPGPTGVPLFGYLPFLSRNTAFKHLTTLTRQYGSVFGIQLGSIYAVVIADVKLIKEALSRQEFQSTPQLLTYGPSRSKGNSKVEIEKFQEQRLFVSSFLQDAVTGKCQSSETMIENHVQDSVQEFLRGIRSGLGDEQDIFPALRHAVGRMMTGMVMGIRFEKENPQWITLQSAFEEISKIANVTSPINYSTLLRRIPNYAKEMKTLVSGSKRSDEIYRKTLEEQLTTANGKEESESILSAYIRQMRKEGMNELSVEEIQPILSELVNGGWETSLATLKWLYLYMALYPDIQDNVAREVEKVVGRKGRVRFSDLTQLPYAEATILEIWRHQTVLPLGVFHSTKKKSKIGDYVIPGDSMIIPLMWAVHHDSRLWQQPEVFCPERFLYEDGSVFRNENLVSLKTGSRMDIGEELRRMTVMLFLANTLNEFQIQFPKAYTYKFMEASEFGTTLVPKPYQLLLQTRHK